MGMYSTYNWEEIEVKDKEALIKIKKEKRRRRLECL